MPEAIDLDERREGSISHIDRIDPGARHEIAGHTAFDDDWLHASWRDFIQRVAALPEPAPKAAATHLSTLIAEAKRLRQHVT